MSEVVNLEELCTGIIDCPHSTPKWQDKGIPVIRNYNLKDGKIDCTNLSFVSEEDYKERVKRAIPEESDIIISREAPMGVVGIVPKEFQCCLGQRLVLLKIDKSKCLPKYLLYTLMSEYVQVQIRRINQTGSIVSNLNISSLKELKIPLHNFEEQRKITNILSAIDDKIQINNQINQELEAMAKTLYDYWFVQFDFPDQNGKRYKSSGGKMVYNPELKREIPEGWGVDSLWNIANFYNGLAMQKYRPDTNEDDYLPVIKIREMMNGFSKDTEKARLDIPTEAVVERGDILFSWSATLEVIIWGKERGALNQHIFKVTSDTYPKSFIYFELKSYLKVFKAIAELRKTTMGHITQDHLKQAKIVVPPIEIISKLDAKLQPIMLKQQILENQNQELIQLRDWLLPMLMNGQVKKE
ncbi:MULTISPECIES: restriction endonuclease subunit S [unclassified Streptococcus]|uniref:restriction endonuclease subunit S n=1 Tax=unclassified Streptococcus TaxID=2608887 RepID=UPI003985324E